HIALTNRIPMPPVAAISADRQRLAFFSLEGQTGFDVQLEVWDLISQRRMAVLKPRLGRGQALSFAPDGRNLAATYDNVLVVYASTQFGPTLSLEGSFEGPLGATIGAPAGLLAIPATQEFGVQLIHLQSGRELAFLNLAGSPMGQYFSQDG